MLNIVTAGLKLLLHTAILFISFHSYTNAVEYDYRYWKKLLHFGDKQSRVVSKEFFLSPHGQTDYLTELDETIKLLNSKYGQEVACNFPARYTWLKMNIKNTPYFNIKQCPELNEFKNNLQKQSVNLVFASEYLDNPVSSFGHTLLVFRDKDKPVLSADTIHFAAKTDNQDGFIKYVWKGLTGGYPGYFFRDPFFKKQYQYNISEQRFLHLYTLDFNDEQIEMLINHLFELRKATFKYYFINENCAFQIGNFLDIASNEISFPDSGFVLPIEVMKKHRLNYRKYRVLYPASAKVKHLLNGMSDTEAEQFDKVLNGQLLPDNSFSNRVKQALSVYYEYDFRKNRNANPNYKKVMQLHYLPVVLDIKSPQPLDKQDTRKLAVSHLNQASQQSWLFSYRPFLQDQFDVPLKNQQEFELSLFNPVIKVKDNVTTLSRFDLITIKSYSPRSRYFKPVSWQFYTGLNRQNPDEKLDYEAEFGLGLAYQMRALIFNLGINIGVDVSAGDYYYKPNASLLLGLSEHIKLGVNAFEKYYQENNYIERNAFVTYEFGHNALSMQYTTKSSNDEIFGVSFFHYY